MLPFILVAGPMADSGLSVAVPALLLTGPLHGLLGLALALRSAGLLGALFIGGILADKVDRRFLIAGTQAVRTALLLLLPWLTGQPDIFMLFVMLLLGICGGLFQPAAATALALSADTASRPTVLARWHSLSLTLQVVAPAGIGLLISAAGRVVPFFALGTCCAVGAMLTASLIPSLRTAPAQQVIDKGSGILRDVLDGFADVTKSPWMRRVALTSAIQVLLPVPAWTYLIAVQSGHWPPGAQGYVLAAFSVGGVLAARLAGSRPPRKVILGSLLAQASVAAGLVTLGADGGLIAMLMVAVPVGAGVRLGVVWEDIAVAANVPADRLGRVSALYMAMSNALMPVGLAAVGAIQPRIGTPSAAMLAAAVSVVATAIGVLSSQARAVSPTPPPPEPISAASDIASV